MDLSRYPIRSMETMEGSTPDAILRTPPSWAPPNKLDGSIRFFNPCQGTPMLFLAPPADR